MRLEHGADLVVVVASAESRVPGRVSARPDWSALEDCFEHLVVVAVRPPDCELEGDARASNPRAPLDSRPSAVGQVRPGFLATEGGFGHGPVHLLPGPSEIALFVFAEEGVSPEALHDLGLGPVLEAVAGDGCRDVAAGKGVPLDSGEGDEEDCLQAASVVGARLSPDGAGTMARKERVDPVREGSRGPKARFDQGVEQLEAGVGHRTIPRAKNIRPRHPLTRICQGLSDGLI
jgi:hypothetical protein